MENLTIDEIEESYKKVDSKEHNAKIRRILKKVFTIYKKKKDILEEPVVDKMLVNSYERDESMKTGIPVSKLTMNMDRRIDAERFVKFIDSLLDNLDPLSRDIIDLVYIDEETNTYIMNFILLLNQKTYYRKKNKAERAMYNLLLMDYKKLMMAF